MSDINLSLTEGQIKNLLILIDSGRTDVINQIAESQLSIIGCDEQEQLNYHNACIQLNQIFLRNICNIKKILEDSIDRHYTSS